MIKYIPYQEVSASLKLDLEHYAEQEFGHVPYVKERVWAQPDWVVLNYEKDSLVTFYNVVLREITLDGETQLVAGINNVITPTQFRGKGY